MFIPTCTTMIYNSPFNTYPRTQGTPISTGRSSQPTRCYEIVQPMREVAEPSCGPGICPLAVLLSWRVWSTMVAGMALMAALPSKCLVSFVIVERWEGLVRGGEREVAECDETRQRQRDEEKQTDSQVHIYTHT